MARLFDIGRVNPSPARFDLKKCTAINGDWIRSLPIPTLVDRIQPFLAEAELVDSPPNPEQRRILDEAVPLIAERLETLSQSVGMLGFLLVAEEDFVIEEDQAAGLADEDAQEVLRAAEAALAQLAEWRAEDIQAVLRESLVEGLGRKPKHAFGPVRAAISGRRVSPPLFESMEILGRERSLGRLASAMG